jgi:hypothetical protein
MSRIIINLGILLLGGIATNATAGDCTPGSTGVKQNPSSVLGGQRITAVGGGEEWKEDHCPGGTLYKVGTTDGPPKHPERPSVDPRAPKGSWSSNGSVITYNYENSGPFNFEIWQDTAGIYFFCDGSAVVATITAGPSTIPDTCP